MNITKLTAALLAAMTLCISAGCSGNGSAAPKDDTPAAPSEAAAETTAWASAFIPSNEGQLDITKLPQFDLSSDDLHDGVWDTDITNTKNGSNRSPQLSWEAVDGASCYGIYMIDTSAGSWMHWKSLSSGETVLPAGWAPGSEYVGPYPPDGTHDYEILVFAFKNAPEKLKGSFDSSNPKLLEAFRAMNGEEGGNIISCGHIKGTYTHGN